MLHYGLIGKSLTHSFSKDYFTNKFEKEKIDADYSLCELESIEEVKGVFSKEWKGLNVTIPYKEQIIPFLNELDEIAATVGAVNTIKIGKKSGQKWLKGFNTDVIGFETTLTPLLQKHHTHALLLGTGGASKAVAYVLERLNISFLYVSREAGLNKLGYDELSSDLIETHTLIINTTPLGMFPDIDGYPDIPYRAVGKKHLLYDLIYNPAKTQFLIEGEMRGATIKNGLDMLIKQAEVAYKIWKQQ
ncbi:MAG TPA: shikimate dehydrogenase [Paludibacteraceae bacterium]|nr:shikimate dehydrogenase [Paludibacteraceae bacterium]